MIIFHAPMQPSFIFLTQDCFWSEHPLMSTVMLQDKDTVPTPVAVKNHPISRKTSWNAELILSERFPLSGCTDYKNYYNLLYVL